MTSLDFSNKIRWPVSRNDHWIQFRGWTLPGLSGVGFNGTMALGPRAPGSETRPGQWNKVEDSEFLCRLKCFFLILWSGFWMILDDFLQISFQILSGFHGTFMWVLLGGVTRTWRSDPPNHGGFHRISVVSYKDQWGYTVSNKGWNSLVGCWFQFCVTTNYRLARKEWFLGKILASPSGIQRSAGEWLRVGSS